MRAAKFKTTIMVGETRHTGFEWNGSCPQYAKWIGRTFGPVPRRRRFVVMDDSATVRWRGVSEENAEKLSDLLVTRFISDEICW
jgi:hypothetical protein